jgi:hypothetical protein
MDSGMKYFNPVVKKIDLPFEILSQINSYYQNSRGYTSEEIIEIEKIKHSRNKKYQNTRLIVEVYVRGFYELPPSFIKNGGMYNKYNRHLFIFPIKMELTAFKMAFNNKVITDEDLSEYCLINRFECERSNN